MATYDEDYLRQIGDEALNKVERVEQFIKEHFGCDADMLHLGTTGTAVDVVDMFKLMKAVGGKWGRAAERIEHFRATTKVAARAET